LATVHHKFVRIPELQFWFCSLKCQWLNKNSAQPTDFMSVVATE